MTRFILAAAVVFAAAALDMRPVQAAAPWCAVLGMGDGDAYWDCSYASIEECRPNVLAGRRGFCNPNPAYVAEQPQQRRVAHRRHRVHQD